MKYKYALERIYSLNSVYALDSVAFHRVEGRRSCDTFCHFLTGTCLSQTLIIFVGIALFASIAVLQTTVYLVLEGINTRSFRCCSKVLKLVHSMRKGKYSWNTLETWKLSSFSLLTSVLMFPFYFFSVVYGRTLGEHSEIVIVQ